MIDKLLRNKNKEIRELKRGLVLKDKIIDEIIRLFDFNNDPKWRKEFKDNVTNNILKSFAK